MGSHGWAVLPSEVLGGVLYLIDSIYHSGPCTSLLGVLGGGGGLVALQDSPVSLAWN